MHIHAKIADVFKEILTKVPEQTMVVGYRGVDALGFQIDSPIQLQSCLGPKLHRDCLPQITTAIDTLFDDLSVDKEHLEEFLLEKYLAGESAQQSEPQADSPDYMLHLLTLQPYRLFGILPEKRGDISRQNDDSRQWQWKKGNDASPLFRKVINILLLHKMIEKAEGDEEKVKTYQEQADKLLKEMNEFGSQIATKMKQPQHESNVKGEARGWVYPDIVTFIDRHLPGISEVLSPYAFGRLLLGQPAQEERALIASRNIPKESYRIRKGLQFAFQWVFGHLNLFTSLFWLQVTFAILKAKLNLLRYHITDPNSSFLGTFIVSLMLIPNFFILIASPILMLLSPMYGLTSMPFSALRYMFLHGPLARTKNYTWLKYLDGLELVKDLMLFSLFAVPLLNMSVMMATSLMPTTLLTIALVGSSLMMLPGALALIGGLVFALRGSRFFRPLGWLISWGMGIYLAIGIRSKGVFGLVSHTLALFRYFLSHNVISQLAASSFLGLGTYLGIAVLGKATYSNLSEAMRNRIAWVFSPVVWLGNGMARMFNAIANVFRKPSQNTTFVGKHVAFIRPPVVRENPIPEALRTQADECYTRLGQLNGAFNLSAERKAIIRELMEKLEIEPDMQESDLHDAIKQTNVLLKDNCSPDDINRLKGCLDDLDGMQREKQAMRVCEMRNIGFQPSWKLIGTLKEQGRFDTLPAELQEKCKHIEALKKAPSPAA